MDETAISVHNAMDNFHSWMGKTPLTPQKHQEEGVAWLLKRELTTKPFQGVRGGLLADDMGLGKTIQMLGLIMSNFQSPTLIVVPPALISQWEKKIQTLLGHTPFVYHGYSATKTPLQIISTKLIVLTTYGMISLRETKGPKKETLQKIIPKLSEVKWGRVIFDEAHHLRNANTKAHKGALLLKAGSKWLVTGTPIQNKIGDYFSLCDVLGIPKTWSREKSNIATFATEFFLRRTKSEVGISLPKLEIQTVETKWESNEERNLAKEIHSMMDFTNVTVKNVDLLMQFLSNHQLPVLLYMKQMCIAPEMLHGKLEKYLLSGLLDQTQTASLREAISANSKLTKVLSVIKERKHTGAKIVFSNFHKEIDYLRENLLTSGFRTQVIDGRTPKHMRQSILESTENDVLILQINSACEGLNLQYYNEIYFTSPHWNPSVEDQAIARAYRMGQTKDVFVFRFVMEDFSSYEMSLDSYILKVQEKKREIMSLL